MSLPIIKMVVAKQRAACWQPDRARPCPGSGAATAYTPISRSWALADGAAAPPGRPVHTDRAPASDPAHPAGAGVNANHDEQDPENSPPADDTARGLDRPIGAAAPDVDPDHPSGRPPSEISARRGRAPHQAAERGADEPPG
jgi:hypothetical protein